MGLYAEKKDDQSSWGSALQRMNVLPLIEFPNDGLILYYTTNVTMLTHGMAKMLLRSMKSWYVIEA